MIARWKPVHVTIYHRLGETNALCCFFMGFVAIRKHPTDRLACLVHLYCILLELHKGFVWQLGLRSFCLLTHLIKISISAYCISSRVSIKVFYLRILKHHIRKRSMETEKCGGKSPYFSKKVFPLAWGGFCSKRVNALNGRRKDFFRISSDVANL